MRNRIILSTIIILIVLTGFIPNTVFAQIPPISTETLTELANAPACYNGKFVPCDGTDKCPCDFRALMLLIDNVLGFLTNVIAIPLAVVTFMYAGFLLMTTAISDQKSKAKEMMRKVVIGFVILLAARLIVKTVLGVLLNPTMFDKIFTF